LILTFAKLVRSFEVVVDGSDRLVQIGGWRVGGGDRLGSGLDLDGAVAAGGADELLDGPAGDIFRSIGDTACFASDTLNLYREVRRKTWVVSPPPMRSMRFGSCGGF
jgi:hypothetical protein